MSEYSSDQVARAAIGALVSLRDLAEIGLTAGQVVEFADLAAIIAADALDLDLTSATQRERLRDENVKLMAESRHTK